MSMKERSQSRNKVKRPDDDQSQSTLELRGLIEELCPASFVQKQGCSTTRLPAINKLPSDTGKSGKQPRGSFTTRATFEINQHQSSLTHVKKKLFRDNAERKAGSSRTIEVAPSGFKRVGDEVKINVLRASKAIPVTPLNVKIQTEMHIVRPQNRKRFLPKVEENMVYFNLAVLKAQGRDPFDVENDEEAQILERITIVETPTNKKQENKSNSGKEKQIRISKSTTKSTKQSFKVVREAPLQLSIEEALGLNKSPVAAKKDKNQLMQRPITLQEIGISFDVANSSKKAQKRSIMSLQEIDRGQVTPCTGRQGLLPKNFVSTNQRHSDFFMDDLRASLVPASDSSDEKDSQMCLYQKFVTTTWAAYQRLMCKKNTVNTPCIKFIRKHPGRKLLVLDLDETLIHCTENYLVGKKFQHEVDFITDKKIWIRGYLNIRPHAIEFLQSVSRHFEVVVLTASQQYYADKIMEYLDPERKYVSAMYYRDSCVRTQCGITVKDLRMFEPTPLKDIILVDNSGYCFWPQPDCGIPIKNFFNDTEDSELKKLEVFLLHFKSNSDHRPSFRAYFKLHRYVRAADVNSLLTSLKTKEPRLARLPTIEC